MTDAQDMPNDWDAPVCTCILMRGRKVSTGESVMIRVLADPFCWAKEHGGSDTKWRAKG